MRPSGCEATNSSCSAGPAQLHPERQALSPGAWLVLDQGTGTDGDPYLSLHVPLDGGLGGAAAWLAPDERQPLAVPGDFLVEDGERRPAADVDRVARVKGHPHRPVPRQDGIARQRRVVGGRDVAVSYTHLRA